MDPQRANRDDVPEENHSGGAHTLDRQARGWPDRLTAALVAAAIALIVLAVALAVTEPWLLAVLAVPALAGVLVARRIGGGGGLQIAQMERLRQAELALAGASSTHAAARNLADHAIALLGASSATVIIEGIGDTVRVTRGDAAGSIYGDGSRMRLLDDDGVPCGSIAVSVRADGRPYTASQERMLDALAQRVSSTLHRLSLFTEVQAERRTLSDVLESSSDGIFTVGLDMSVRSWNPAMARIVGVPADDAIGNAVSSIFRPMGEDDQPRHGQADPGRTGSPVTELVRIDGAGGELRWLTCSWAPLSEGGYVVVARDDTERKKLQDDKDGWIAQVSHELRTPLTPIKGFLHTLQRRDEQFTTADRQRIYEVMLREEQRLEDLVTSLLQATTIDQRGLVVVPEVVDWPTVVEDQVDVYRRSDPSRTIDLRLQADEHVVADQNLAISVLTNLLSNALKYSPPGTPVDVDVTLDGDRVVTSVTDRGEGIAPSDRERIFQKFTRLGDHLTRPQQGVGLGLYIARRCVEEMGGEITCDAGEAGGARFAFTLPAHAPPPASRRARRPAATESKGGPQRPLRA
jgi:PAS domain S-box-containing protein